MIYSPARIDVLQIIFVLGKQAYRVDIRLASAPTREQVRKLQDLSDFHSWSVLFILCFKSLRPATHFYAQWWKNLLLASQVVIL